MAPYLGMHRLAPGLRSKLVLLGTIALAAACGEGEDEVDPPAGPGGFQRAPVSSRPDAGDAGPKADAASADGTIAEPNDDSADHR